MEYKIVLVELRPWWKRVWWINDWKVTVEDGRGRRFSFNAWGNRGNPNPSSLLYDIKRELRKRTRNKVNPDMMNSLVGEKVQPSTGSAK